MQEEPLGRIELDASAREAGAFKGYIRHDPQAVQGEPGHPQPAWRFPKSADSFLQKPRTAHLGSNFTCVILGFTYFFFGFFCIDITPISLNI